jgi:hypothetical protein
MMCGCKLIYGSSNDNGKKEKDRIEEIVYCPLHAAAPMLFDALRECERYISSLTIIEAKVKCHDEILRNSREAIAAVI